MAWMFPLVVTALLGSAGPAADAAFGSSVTLCLARGWVDEALGQWDQAATRYQLGLATFDEDPELLLALIHVEVRRRRLLQASRLTDVLVAHAAFRARALLCRAAIHEALGEEAEARADRDKALDELDVVLTNRALAEQFFEQARALIAAGRHRGAPPTGDDEAPPPLGAMRAQLRDGRRR